MSAARARAAAAADVELSAAPLGASRCLNVPATIGQDCFVIDLNGVCIRDELRSQWTALAPGARPF